MERRGLTEKEFEMVGAQLFACPRADMFKGEAGNVSQMFASYMIMEPLLLDKALAAPHDMVRFARGEWRSLLKGKADDWDPRTRSWLPEKTEEYVKIFGLHELYNQARGAVIDTARVVTEEQPLFLLDLSEDDSTENKWSEDNSTTKDTRSSSPAPSTAATSIFSASEFVSDWYTRASMARGYLDIFCPTAPNGQLALRPEKSRAEVQPNGWRERGPGRPTGFADFRIFKQKDAKFEANEFVFVLVGHSAGKAGAALTEAEDVWESFDLAAVFLFDEFAHPALQDASGEHIFDMPIRLTADGGPDEVHEHVRVWHGHEKKRYVL